jgi:hypothetical protein
LPRPATQTRPLRIEEGVLSGIWKTLGLPAATAVAEAGRAMGRLYHPMVAAVAPTRRPVSFRDSTLRQEGPPRTPLRVSTISLAVAKVHVKRSGINVARASQILCLPYNRSYTETGRGSYPAYRFGKYSRIVPSKCPQKTKYWKLSGR